ncbi:MAG: RNA polymerase sigma factor, partial [Candidatus Dormibacteraeota bacterium]|nr:RNA polymerase sigma factor [Candidatus Dormibacteraeota bacterium]
MESDTALVERLAGNDVDAFGDLVRRYQHRLFAFALGMTGDAGDAEEVAQDAFLRAHRALARYEPERIRELRLSAWLHRIALN